MFYKNSNIKAKICLPTDVQSCEIAVCFCEFFPCSVFIKKKEHPVKGVLFSWWRRRGSTLDLTDANRTLSQLSYAPTTNDIISCCRGDFNYYFQFVLYCLNYMRQKLPDPCFRPYGFLHIDRFFCPALKCAGSASLLPFDWR